MSSDYAPALYAEGKTSENQTINLLLTMIVFLMDFQNRRRSPSLAKTGLRNLMLTGSAAIAATTYSEVQNNEQFRYRSDIRSLHCRSTTNLRLV